MNRHVNAIAGRLSLRPPQSRSLEILVRITEIVPPRNGIFSRLLPGYALKRRYLFNCVTFFLLTHLVFLYFQRKAE
jgi:hypothetical protein